MKKFKTIITAFLVAVLMVPLGLVFSACGDDDWTYVRTEEELTAAVAAGGTIAVENSIQLTDTLTVTKDTTLKITGTIDAPEDKPAITVTGGTLTITSGSVEATKGTTAIAINVTGGKVVFGEGAQRVKGITSAVKVAGGEVTINGGTFSVTGSDKSKVLDGTGISVNAGKFVDFDPTAFLADGYEAVEFAGEFTVRRK